MADINSGGQQQSCPSPHGAGSHGSVSQGERQDELARRVSPEGRMLAPGTGSRLAELSGKALMQDALFDLPEPAPEHAVIARFQLGGEGLGESEQWSRVFEAERFMGAAVAAAGVGEVDGNEFGGGEVVIFAYGPDADALYRVMEPGLRALPFRPAHVVLRYGEPADDVVSARIEL